MKKGRVTKHQQLLYIYLCYRAYENGLIGGYKRNGFPDSVGDDCIDEEDNAAEDSLGLRRKEKVMIWIGSEPKPIK